MDALASWNCRLLLYSLVDVHDIETFRDISAKNKLQIYNPMCFYAVCYSLERNISGICWVHVQHVNYVTAVTQISFVYIQ
jgi:hypothetical protein